MDKVWTTLKLDVLVSKCLEKIMTEFCLLAVICGFAVS